jgi:hypothetical protein
MNRSILVLCLLALLIVPLMFRAGIPYPAKHPESPFAAERTSSSPTADEIAGTGDEIARARDQKKPDYSMEEAVAEHRMAVATLIAELDALAGNAELLEIKRLLNTIPELEQEYVRKRKSGADAQTLRGLAQSFGALAHDLDRRFSENPAFAGLRAARHAEIDAGWKLRRLDGGWKLANEAVRSIEEWDDAFAISSRLRVHLLWDVRDTVRSIERSGETVTEELLSRALLKYSVIYLESLVR